MVGFRNIAANEYQNLDLQILKNIIEKNLDDIIEFKEGMYQYAIDLEYYLEPNICQV